VMLCKLAMHDQILKVETAITYDEFKEEKKWSHFGYGIF
jgi:hypothetical protein